MLLVYLLLFYLSSIFLKISVVQLLHEGHHLHQPTRLLRYHLVAPREIPQNVQLQIHPYLVYQIHRQYFHLQYIHRQYFHLQLTSNHPFQIYYICLLVHLMYDIFHQQLFPDIHHHRFLHFLSFHPNDLH